jgi:hypothetical protein
MAHNSINFWIDMTTEGFKIASELQQKFNVLKSNSATTNQVFAEFAKARSVNKSLTNLSICIT